MSRRYRITHHTTYAYDDDVTDSYGVAYCRPRSTVTQQVDQHEIWTEPGHSDLGFHDDGDGNRLAYFHVTEPHRRLVVSAVSVVACVTPHRDALVDGQPWESARPTAPGEGALAWTFTQTSPLVDVTEAVTAYAGESFAPGRPLIEAVLDLNHRIHTDFDYEPGSTTVTTRVDDVLELRRGVCQDFAHLLIACLRSQGLAARYVSGYLSTDPPPGRDRVVGADATHAWVECFVPGAAWLPVDPTNDCVVGDRHITVAWGRDYGDIPPVKGVIFTDATESTMSVSVDVAPV